MISTTSLTLFLLRSSPFTFFIGRDFLFNAPTIKVESSDIVLHWRNGQLRKIAETHQCYDALQYPVIFWYGADGYHFIVKIYR
ncbi:unnamed protein product [Onchocerca flexuosa]|uniref:Uncharacterized protein n=1 Tax=Onchocerca flexuosa TaxID=387005 RepID=A0A183HJL4_9BILA|nr:unnamed protein product [Onchocerca flexuosa]